MAYERSSFSCPLVTARCTNFCCCLCTVMLLRSTRPRELCISRCPLFQVTETMHGLKHRVTSRHTDTVAFCRPTATNRCHSPVLCNTPELPPSDLLSYKNTSCIEVPLLLLLLNNCAVALVVAVVKQLNNVPYRMKMREGKKK